MNFLEAVAQMKEGKKVRRAGWEKPIYGYLEGSKIEFTQGDQLNIHHIQAKDWEIYEEEKKTLSDKVITCNKILHYQQGDVKEHLKEFLEILTYNSSTITYDRIIKEKAKEIFGDKLV